jgi:hypothetical protein
MATPKPAPKSAKEIWYESGRFDELIWMESWFEEVKFALSDLPTDADRRPNQSVLGMPCVLAATPCWRQDEIM